MRSFGEARETRNAVRDGYVAFHGARRPTTPRAPHSKQVMMSSDKAVFRGHVLSDCMSTEVKNEFTLMRVAQGYSRDA